MRTKQFTAILFFLLSVLPEVTAQLKLPRLVRDSMILQRDANIKIWRWAAKGEKVAVQFKRLFTKRSNDR